MIPRILHFTWKNTDLPREMADYYGKWQKLCRPIAVIPI